MPILLFFANIKTTVGMTFFKNYFQNYNNRKFSCYRSIFLDSSLGSHVYDKNYVMFCHL